VRQMACHKQHKMQKYRVGKKAVPKYELRNVSGVFRAHKVKMPKFPYCSPADFDNFVRRAGPKAATTSGIFLTGHYADDLLRWRNAVPPERTLVVFHEDFVEDAVGVIDRIQAFLGIPRFDYATITETEGNMTFIRGTESKAKGGRRYDPMSESTRKELNDYYASSSAKLMGVLGLSQPPTNWPTPSV